MNDEQVAEVARLVVKYWGNTVGGYDVMRLGQRVGWAVDPDTHVVVRWEDGGPLTDDDLLQARALDPFIDEVGTMVEQDIEIAKFEEGLAADA